jgi:hypothetical protein
MCVELLLIIYKLFLERTSMRVAFIERHLATPIESTHISADERRNLPGVYEAMFSADCRPYVEKLYADAMKELGRLPYDRSEETLDGLMFIQEVIATALWKYRCDVGQTLESFARQYDRLDLPLERQRLHDQAQDR